MRGRGAAIAAVLGMAVAAGAAPASASAGARVRVGTAVLDGTYHVGSSAGQYASSRTAGYGDVDPSAQQVKNQASYGFESRESVRALVIEGSDGRYIALVSDDHYIPQDALWRATARLLASDTHGAIGERNLIMSITHNHSSPSYSSLDWGVWSFQDVFDFRFFDYYAHQNAAAVEHALAHMHAARMSATVSNFDAFQKNPMGPTWADDGTPAGFPRPHTDHDLSVVAFENIDHPARPKPLATLVNIGQHPEDLNGYNLISGEYPAATERIVDRSLGGTMVFTQNATGTSEVEEDRWHPVHARELFNHAQYGQMEWAARQLSDAIVADVQAIRDQQPNPDTRPTSYGGTSYHDRFIRWTSSFPVAMEDRWFGGPISHPYPGVSSCRTDAALQGNPRLPVVGLPDCQSVPAGDSLQPVTSMAPLSPGITTATFTALGIPLPANYSAPSTGALEDTLGVHMQAFRLGDVLFTVCSCEQWVEQAWNIKTRTDTTPGNEYLGYDPTNPYPDPRIKGLEQCTRNGDGTYADDGSGTGHWTCTLKDDVTISRTLSDRLVEHMRAQIVNDATGWEDPTCQGIGCGAQAEAEPANPTQIYGNYTHDDTAIRDVHGGGVQSAAFAKRYGYRMTVTISMANDYNGYIASYREFMDRDHYRKALTGWGPHSSDYYATRLTQMGHALKGDRASRTSLDAQTVLAKVTPGWAALVAKEQLDQRHEEAKVAAVAAASSAGVAAYDRTVPDDGQGSAADYTQPKNIQRFDATAYTWVGGGNYTDNPEARVQRCVARCDSASQASWETFADGSGEVPVIAHYPETANCLDLAALYGGDPTNGNLPDPNPGQTGPACATHDVQAIGAGMAGYRLGGQIWRWTAEFEAFVSRFPLVDPQGRRYIATPAGTYRFVVDGMIRRGGKSVRYERISSPFHVAPWTGITVEHPGLDAAGHVTFAAGPTHLIAERTVRNTARRPFHADGSPNPNNDPTTFRIGPVDFPDTPTDTPATGARFLSPVRGYSGTGPNEVEHYCLDCSFRPWLDATDALSARITITRAGGASVIEDLAPDSAGRFVSGTVLAPGDSAAIEIRDAWGDTTAGPQTVKG